MWKQDATSTIPEAAQLKLSIAMRDNNTSHQIYKENRPVTCLLFLFLATCYVMENSKRHIIPSRKDPTPIVTL
eukprot:2614683-Amphidinium_carterae.1